MIRDALSRAVLDAARAAEPWLGSGDLTAIDRAAVLAMRAALANANFVGNVVTCEGAKDHAPMFDIGESLGGGNAAFDLAIDPIDGTQAAAQGLPGAIAAIAAARAGSMFDPGSVSYMEKILVSPVCPINIDLDRPFADSLRQIAKTLDKPVTTLRVAILDRPRNESYVSSARTSGATILSLPYADLSTAVSVAQGNAGIDVLAGIGGSSEGILAAAAAICTGASMTARLWARNQGERDAGADLRTQMRIKDLLQPPVWFCACDIPVSTQVCLATSQSSSIRSE